MIALPASHQSTILRSTACDCDVLFEQVNTDWVGLIDEWSGRFFAELDYEAEAASAMQFQREMAKLDGIVVPDVFLDLTTPYVLTTAWVEGVHSKLLPSTTLLLIDTMPHDGYICLSVPCISSYLPRLVTLL